MKALEKLVARLRSESGPLRRRGLKREAARMWSAAKSLDALHGGDRAWRWTHRQIERLKRAGSRENSEAVAEVADALEIRLARDRESRLIEHDPQRGHRP